MNSDKLRFGHYRILRDLGNGATGKVKLAVNIKTGEQVALKIFRRKYIEMFQVEAKALAVVAEHSNVVKIISAAENAVYNSEATPPQERSFIEMEFCARGELLDYVFSRGVFPEAVVKRCAIEILHGLAYIHERGLAHRDLKPQNILISEGFGVKIADFGFAAVVGRDGNTLCRTKRGTDGFLAPEILSREPYNGQKVDMFTLGVLLFSIFTKHLPFHKAMSSDPHYRYIATEQWVAFWDKVPAFSDGFKEVIQGLLCKAPERRLSCEELIAHAWLREGVCDMQQFAAWLAAGDIPRIAVQKEEYTEGAYKELQMGRSSSLGELDNFEESLFAFASRKPLLSSHSQTAFFIDISPETAFEAAVHWFERRGATVKKHTSNYQLKARVPGNEDCVEVGVYLCEERGSLKVEFVKLNGAHFEFYGLVGEFVRELAEE